MELGPDDHLAFPTNLLLFRSRRHYCGFGVWDTWVRDTASPDSAGFSSFVSGVLAGAAPFALAGGVTLVALDEGDGLLAAALAGAPALAAAPPRAAAPPLAGVEEPLGAAPPLAGR